MVEDKVRDSSAEAHMDAVVHTLANVMVDREGSLCDLHYSMRSRSGEEIPVLFAASALCDRQGQERFFSIVEKRADGMLIVDREGMVNFVSPAAERLLARSASQLDTIIEEADAVMYQNKTRKKKYWVSCVNAVCVSTPGVSP
ncbi:MAG: hypothetical protein HQL90_04020 [Magnetococcales bacterium]|nr:hypothetical protein [Magnetococcales bacterium]